MTLYWHLEAGHGSKKRISATAAALCQRWVREELLVIADPSKKTRRYRLNDELEERIAGRLKNMR